MPSPKPTCASCSVGMRSPRAEMVGMFVRISASMVTKPRSMATPTSSYPIPAETGPRPTATRNSSASIVLPPSRDTVTPESVDFTDSNRAPSSMPMPRLRNARSTSFEEDSSSSGTTCGSASMIVTSAPNERQTEANSQPIAPAPRMATEAGTRSSRSASLESITRSWSISSPGSDMGCDPVASRTCRPSMVRSPTCTVAGDGLDLPRLHQSLQALVQPADDLVLVAVDPRHVDAVERRLDAEVLALPGLVGDLGGVQQRLGGNTTVVQAGAADLVSLHHDDGHAELGRPKRGRVAATAGAENEEVDSVGGCGAGARHGCSWKAGGNWRGLVWEPRGRCGMPWHPRTRNRPGATPERRTRPPRRSIFAGQPAARSSSSWTRVRTAAPVPPLGVYP